MPNNNFLGEVPVPSKPQPLQIPEIRDNADIIMQAAMAQREDKFRAGQALAESVRTAGDLIARFGNMALDKKKGDATLELLRAKDKREEAELEWKMRGGGGGGTDKISAEAANKQSLIREAKKLLPYAKQFLFNPDGSINETTRAQVALGLKMDERSQKAYTAVSKILQIDLVRLTGFAYTAEQFKSVADSLVPGFLARPGAIKFALKNLTEVYDDLDKVYSQRVIPEGHGFSNLTPLTPEQAVQTLQGKIMGAAPAESKPDVPPELSKALASKALASKAQADDDDAQMMTKTAKMTRRDALVSLRDKGLSYEQALSKLAEMKAAGELED